MWIFLRLIAAAVGFGVRFIVRFWPKPNMQGPSGLEYCETIGRNKHGRVSKHTLAVPFDSGVVMSMVRERSWDIFFKALGLSVEFQTGDATFDKKVYLAADHPGFCQALGQSAESRAIIQEVLGTSITKIWSDGDRLYVTAPCELFPDKWVPELHDLKNRLEQLIGPMGSRFADGLAWRILLIESVVWSIAFYAGVAFMEFSIDSRDITLDSSGLMAYGLGLAGAAFGALMFAIVAFLQKSSRSHRVLVESALLLVLSLPIFGIQAASDYNVSADRSPASVIEAKVLDTKIRTVRRRNGKSHHYYVYVAVRPEQGEPLPDWIEVSREHYSSMERGQDILIEIGRGRLNLRWYKSINGIEVL